MKTSEASSSITYKQLGVIAISFLLGVIISLLVTNSQAETITNFTTTELIGFVLTVIVSGASVVLAISAIALGKVSENAVVTRSDESIRLQTELFAQTNDALQHIKASTGVTEKRLEDIISGRAGDLSKQIAEIASDEAISGKVDVKALEEAIRKSISGTFEKEESDEEKKRKFEKRRELMRQRKEYEDAHNALLYSVANRREVRIIKLGHGNPTEKTGEQYGRFDAVFDKGGEQFAVSTFRNAATDRFMRLNLSEIIYGLAMGAEKDSVEVVHLVFFEESEDSEVLNEGRAIASMLKDATASKLQLHAVAYENANKFAEDIDL